jgi:hypothetical protein
MNVKIIKASEDTFWYAKHIGQTFEVEPANPKYLEYVVVPREQHGDFYIMADDCEVE